MFRNTIKCLFLVVAFLTVIIFPVSSVSGAPSLTNAGFENGSLSPWTEWGNGAISSTGQYAGSYCGKFTGAAGGVEQTVTGLTANTSYTPTPTPGSTLSMMQSAGITSNVISYMTSHPRWSTIQNEIALRNTLIAINTDPTVPSNATVITTVSGLSALNNSGTYYMNGNFVLSSPINLVSNTTLYVSGQISFTNQPTTEDPWHVVADNSIFEIDSCSNVKIIGIGNPKLISDNTAGGVKINWDQGSTNVLVEGLDISNTVHGVWINDGENVMIRNNYIHDTLERGMHTCRGGLSSYQFFVHNFTSNTGMDGMDFDYNTSNGVAFENFSVCQGRWHGFTEEGANNCRFVSNCGIMSDWWVGEYNHDGTPILHGLLGQWNHRVWRLLACA